MRALYLILLSFILGGTAMAATATDMETRTAIFAGGCFWCMQPVFDNTPGVIKTEVGYTGGKSANPTYEEVSTGTTGHIEAIRVTYYPAKVKYETLLEAYWENIDPTDTKGQFVDKGSQYLSAIFVADEGQKKLAEASLAEVQKKFGATPIATKILPAQPFYVAETYHQDYYKTHKMNYEMYKIGSGRQSRLEQLWDGKK